MAKSKTTRPVKPRPDFPLFPHASGQWAKKIRGRMHYFGTWDDSEAALNRYLEQRDYLFTGRQSPNGRDHECTVELACNAFLTVKEDRLNSGELSQRHFDDLVASCRRITKEFDRHRLVSDLRPDDFSTLRAKLTRRYGPHALGTEIARIRSVFNWCWKADLIAVPVKYGPDFVRPSAKTMRNSRTRSGKRMFEPETIIAMIDAAGPQLRAMILLGINSGYGNADCGTLPLSAVDLDHGWLSYPRPKTGIERRCPLWPETTDALREVIDSRPKPKAQADAAIVFITKYRQRWAKDSRDNPISKETRKLLDDIGVTQPGLSFYSLRRTFATVAAETGLQIAVNHIMGHADDSMPAIYRQDVADAQLRQVTDYVREWLYATEGADKE